MAPVLPSASFDWENLAFDLYPTNGYIAYKYTTETGWDKGEWIKDPYVRMHVANSAINYGQAIFEGLKAFRSKDGTVRIFRPDENAKRFNQSAEAVCMPEVPEDLFKEACYKAVSGNLEFVPPYAPAAGAGALYIRPLLYGSGAMLQLSPANEYTFIVYVSPVGSLYSKGSSDAASDALVLHHFDRTAPLGTGCYKLAGNYGPTLRHQLAAKKKGYPLTLHLDSATRTLVDEFSTSNFLAIAYDDAQAKTNPTLIVPKSSSILGSITTKSIVELVQAKRFGWKVEQRAVKFDEVINGKFSEVAATGTAAAVSPVKSISYEKDPQNNPDQLTKIQIGDGQKAGQGWINVRKELLSVQCGDAEDEWKWLYPATPEGVLPPQ